MAAKKGLLRVVRKVCLWCQGKSWPMVRKCAQSDCPLHGWRLVDQAEDALVLAALHTFCIHCAGNPEAAAACTADQAIGGHDPCPAHPFRTGKITALIQKIHPLPGLDICQVGQKKYFLTKAEPDGEQVNLQENSEATKLAPTIHRVTQLPFLLPERIPEAPDI